MCALSNMMIVTGLQRRLPVAHLSRFQPTLAAFVKSHWPFVKCYQPQSDTETVVYEWRVLSNTPYDPSCK